MINILFLGRGFLVVVVTALLGLGSEFSPVVVVVVRLLHCVVLNDDHNKIQGLRSCFEISTITLDNKKSINYPGSCKYVIMTP